MTIDMFFRDVSDKLEANYDIVEGPDTREAINFINSNKVNKMLIIFANCTVNYEGRAKSMLSEGDRIIITKPDGTLLVHEDTKREPINWQPPGSIIKAIERNNNLVIISKRDKPREKIEIKVGAIYFIASIRAKRGKFEFYGSEKDMVDKVVKNPNIIEEGLKILRREAPTPYGYIDLVAEDSKGNLVILEFKRSIANFSAALQLMRYVTYYEKILNKKPRGILVAPSITNNSLMILKANGLEYKKIKF